MRKLFLALVAMVTLTATASARDLVPMESVTLAPGVSVLAPCQTASIPYSLQQCIIYEVRLPGDTVDVKKFTFDIPKKVQYQAQEVGFVLRVSSIAPVSHLALAIPDDIRVRWIGFVPPSIITVPEDTDYDLSFVSHDRGNTWEATIMISKMSAPNNFNPRQAVANGYPNAQMNGQPNQGFMQRMAPNTYHAVQNFGSSQQYVQPQQQSIYANQSYYYAP